MDIVSFPYGPGPRTSRLAAFTSPRANCASSFGAGGVSSTPAANTKRALEALEQAAATGFRAWERMEGEPLLAKVRRDARYAGILAKMRR